jgi:hypothetical protein
MKTAGVLLLITLACGVGCVNMSTLQTAQALAPGEQRFIVGGGYYTSPSVDAAASKPTGSDVNLALPYVELGYRRGIIDRLELGAKLTIPGTIGLDGKYQLVQSGNLAVAVGLGGGYLSIDSGSGNDKTSTRLIDILIPAYVSYDIARPFAIYVSPKYIARFASSTDSAGTSSTSVGQLAGGTAGMRIGNKKGIFLEASYLKDLSSTFHSFQVNGAVFF